MICAPLACDEENKCIILCTSWLPRLIINLLVSKRKRYSTYDESGWCVKTEREQCILSLHINSYALLSNSLWSICAKILLESLQTHNGSSSDMVRSGVRTTARGSAD